MCVFITEFCYTVFTQIEINNRRLMERTKAADYFIVENIRRKNDDSQICVW